MARWALTGGIATGKSTVAALFVQAHIPVVDADRIYHRLIAPLVFLEGPSAPSPLALQVGQAFPGVLQPDHTLDRGKLGALIFADPTARRRLEAITHPAVHAQADLACAAYEAAGHATVLYDVPLLFERGLQGDYAKVVLVHVPQALQLQRLMARDTLSLEAAQARLASQWPIDDKRSLAQHIIDNSQSREHTAAQVHALVAKIRGTKGP